MSHRLYRIENRRMVTGLAICLTALYAGNSYSRPDMRPLGPNIADEGSSFYHFTISKFDSVDGKRHYKVWTAVPDKAPPKAGFPVLYLLDGNSAMARLSEPLLKKLSEHSPPVLVAIGYQTALPFDQLARTLDYTPASNKRGNDIPEVDSNGRMRGEVTSSVTCWKKPSRLRLRKGLKSMPLTGESGVTLTADYLCWTPTCPLIFSPATIPPVHPLGRAIFFCWMKSNPPRRTGAVVNN